MTDTVARCVAADDWATLRAVRLAALADAPDAFGSTRARELAFGEAEWRRRTGSPSFIAWRAGVPVGLISAVDRTKPGGPDGREHWELVSMWVAPDARGSGVADLLVSALMDAVRVRNAERLSLWVATDNARALGFYLRFGFRPTGSQQVFTRHDGSSFDEQELAIDLDRAPAGW
jgi:ribosomal protein S18 acetylase RimI-like enzyme